MQDFRKKGPPNSNQKSMGHWGTGPGSKPSITVLLRAFVSQLTRVTWPSIWRSSKWWIQNPGGEVTSSLFGKVLWTAVNCFVFGVLNHTESTLLMLEKMRYIRYTCHPVESDTWNSYDAMVGQIAWISEVLRVAPSLHHKGDFLIPYKINN